MRARPRPHARTPAHAGRNSDRAGRQFDLCPHARARGAQQPQTLAVVEWYRKAVPFSFLVQIARARIFLGKRRAVGDCTRISGTVSVVPNPGHDS
jgi:hypothetical protein